MQTEGSLPHSQEPTTYPYWATCIQSSPYYFVSSLSVFNRQFHSSMPQTNISISHDQPRQEATVHLSTSGTQICKLRVRMIEDNAWHWPRGRRNAEMNTANPQGTAVRSRCVRNAALQVRGEQASPCEQQLQWMSCSARQIYLQRVKGKDKRDKMATQLRRMYCP
jgi:hypothetical protein